MTTEPVDVSKPEFKDLNALYGDALEPGRFDPLEKEIRPRSLQRLDESTAKLLKGLMTATSSGLGISSYVYCSLPILWATDKDGEIFFAVEEMIDLETREFVYPRVPGAPVDNNRQRLGHPALLAAAPGRIAGEILFDVKAEPPVWVITNASGRYGLRRGRKSEHLTNVCSRFADFGIKLMDQFIPPRKAK